MWQSIDTAPKDGSRYLACVGLTGEIQVARFVDGCPRFLTHELFLKYEGRYESYPITHWMPLPVEPK